MTTTLDQIESAVCRARNEIGRLRARVRRGEHEAAARLLDVALDAVAQAEAVASAVPYHIGAVAELRPALDAAIEVG